MKFPTEWKVIKLHGSKPPPSTLKWCFPWCFPWVIHKPTDNWASRHHRWLVNVKCESFTMVDMEHLEFMSQLDPHETGGHNIRFNHQSLVFLPIAAVKLLSQTCVICIHIYNNISLTWAPLWDSHFWGSTCVIFKEQKTIINTYQQLIGGFNHLEKYEFVNGKDYPIYHGK